MIYDENNTFDHYFGLYPKAENPPGEPAFHARQGTPAVNGLTPELLYHNPNATQPFRLDRDGSFTCNPKGGYALAQHQFNHGLMDMFVSPNPGCKTAGIPMAYVDGNTVTGLWNYAQNFALNDNSFQTNFGQSLEGHINLVSGQTHGTAPQSVDRYVSRGTVIGDIDPAFDDCSKDRRVAMTGTNVGELLNKARVTWGWFQGGFAPSRRVDGKPVCDSSHQNIVGDTVPDYVPHHEPFQYYSATANPAHLPPSSEATVGHADRANHQYDLSWFWRAAESGHQPQVSFLKADHYQDGHPGFSDPLDEQHFLVDTVNRIERLPTWRSTAIIIAYDDPGGWYDHVVPKIIRSSDDQQFDSLSGAGRCGNVDVPGKYPLRCGYAARLPLLAISPYARVNYVDHTLTDQTSILSFIEDNWHLGRIGNDSYDAQAGSIENMFDFSRRRASPLFLNANTGEPITQRRKPTLRR